VARIPGAVWRPIPGMTTPMRSHDLLVFHTMVGYLKTTDTYFRQQSNNSHGGVGGQWGADIADNLDGALWQWVDTSYRSAATKDGNPRVLAFEFADNAPKSAADIAPFTAKQQDTAVDLIVWAHRAYGIPLQLATDSRPGTVGVGYHRLGCDPYRAAGGELWSNSYGKVCPGDARIAQIPDLIERARRVVAGTTTEGAFMALSDVQQQRLLDLAEATAKVVSPMAQRVSDIERRQLAINTQEQGRDSDDAARDGQLATDLAAAKAELDQILAAMPAPTPTPVPGSSK
jgi:hypothetical protein